MRRRIYFVLPDKASADKIEHELLLSRIDDNHIHFMATVGLDGLPQASLLLSSDLTHGMMLGLISGGLAGAAVGILLMLYPQADRELGAGLIFVLALVGALFGIWAASLIAVRLPNSRLNAFERDISEGHILFMVDLPKERVEEISALIKARHPEAQARGVDPSIPAVP